MLTKLKNIIFIFAVIAGLVMVVPQSTSASHGYGGGNEKETVCKKTGNRFVPYVKVTVPEFIANKFLHEGGVLPNSNGKCPQGISIHDYISDLLNNIFKKHS